MIVLDTHVMLWWANGDTTQLSSMARKAIAAELKSGRVIISSISAWELAMLVARERVMLALDTREWLHLIGQIEGVEFMPVTNDIAINSVELPGEFHKDPADRLIVATARQLGAVLITADEKIRNYPHLRTLW